MAILLGGLPAVLCKIPWPKNYDGQYAKEYFTPILKKGMQLGQETGDADPTRWELLQNRVLKKSPRSVFPLESCFFGLTADFFCFFLGLTADFFCFFFGLTADFFGINSGFFWD